MVFGFERQILLQVPRNMRRCESTLIAIFISLMLIAPAGAQDDGSVMNAASVNPSLYDHVQFRIGPFFAKWDSTVELKGQDFDLDERLGESDTVLAIGGFARITNRVRFNFNYWASNREDTEILGAPTPVGPFVLPPGTQFDQNYETSTIRGGLGWAFVSSDNAEVGIDVGLSLVTIRNNLTGRLPDAPPLTLVNVDDTEPMGTIGLFMQYAISPRWSVAGRAGALGFDLGNIDGKIYSVEARLEYRPLRNVGLGVAYSYDNADVILKDGDAGRNITYTTKGILTYLSFGFGSVR
jgi:hypothetical protein